MAKSNTSFSKVTIVKMISLLTAAMGIVNVLSAVTPSLKERLKLLEEYSPFGVNQGGHLTSAIAGFALLLLAGSLWRRKHVGWILTISILSLSIPTHLIKGLDYEEAILAAVLIILLTVTRDNFQARSDPPSVRTGIWAVLASLSFTLAYGILGFYLLDRHFQINFGFWAALRQTIVMFTEFYDPGLQPITGFGKYFADSIYMVGVVTSVYALLMLFRPVISRLLPSTDERSRAWGIVKAYGSSSLARYTLLDDKLHFFSADGSVISYVIENRVALVLGDPIGPQNDAEHAIVTFKDYCAVNDWIPAFYQIKPDLLNYYDSIGFVKFPIGHEASVDLSIFTLDGSDNKTLRNSYNKMLRNGYKASIHEPPHSTRMLRELRAISDDWLSSRGMKEMGFSLGWFDEGYLNTCPILLVRDAEGFIDAFANIVTEFQSVEVAVDLMRHRSFSEKGIMDFLFVSLFQWAKEKGISSFNLGLSTFSGIGENPGDPAIERTLRFLYENINRFYNFKGLHAFKEKFHPTWSPRYLAFLGAGNLPMISLSLLRASYRTNVIPSLPIKK